MIEVVSVEDVLEKSLVPLGHNNIIVGRQVGGVVFCWCETSI
jgi:hypothetical protein